MSKFLFKDGKMMRNASGKFLHLKPSGNPNDCECCPIIKCEVEMPKSMSIVVTGVGHCGPDPAECSENPWQAPNCEYCEDWPGWDGTLTADRCNDLAITRMYSEWIDSPYRHMIGNVMWSTYTEGMWITCHDWGNWNSGNAFIDFQCSIGCKKITDSGNPFVGECPAVCIHCRVTLMPSYYEGANCFADEYTWYRAIWNGDKWICPSVMTAPSRHTACDSQGSDMGVDGDVTATLYY